MIGSHWTLRSRLVFFVFCIMLFSSLVSAFTLTLISGSRWFRPIFTSQLVTGAALLTMSGFIGTLATARLSKYYLSTIIDLKEASLRVAKGDFTVSVPEEGSSETRQLVRSFNSMVRELGSIEIFRNDFIDSFSHEFKTPIVSIQGYARQLLRDDLSAAERREYAAIIVDESQRLARLASNILRLSNLESRQIAAEHAPFRLDEQIRSCILLLEKDWSAKSLNLDVELENVICDQNADLLSEVWVNLLHNAVKFTPSGGTVAVRLIAVYDTARVTVRDTGIGMTPETQAHVFEKFYQGDASHHPDGSGLGLPLAKRIVELCGGNIAVQSQEGKGSLFTVHLPLRQ